MSYVEDMRRTLNRKDAKPSSGTVTEVRGGTLVVKSNKGAVITTSAGQGTYSVGDRVQLLNNVVVAKLTSTAGKTVYIV